jgi:sucrose-6-phosphate hydrolase SacC (GH32 family)
LRYSGQIPGCITKVPCRAIENTFSLSRNLERAMTRSGRELPKNVRAPLRPREGRVRLHVLLDRGSIEVFGNDGRVALSIAAIPDDGNRSIGVFHRGGPAKVHSLVVHELRPAWGSP